MNLITDAIGEESETNFHQAMNGTLRILNKEKNKASNSSLHKGMRKEPSHIGHLNITRFNANSTLYNSNQRAHDSMKKSPSQRKYNSRMFNQTILRQTQNNSNLVNNHSGSRMVEKSPKARNSPNLKIRLAFANQTLFNGQEYNTIN